MAPSPNSPRPSHLRLVRTTAPQSSAPSSEDGELVRRARGGDFKALGELFQRYVKSLRGKVTRLIGRRSDAEDIVQEVLLTATADLPRLRDPDAFRAWLHGIAVRKVYRYFRTQRLLRMLGLDHGAEEATFADLAAPGATPEQIASLVELGAFLATVPIDHRIAWSLHKIEGEPIEEVARVCDCSRATVFRRIKVVQEKIEQRSKSEGDKP
jgi:RNA polymerase sigma-70 factor (ECF subfamily)